MQASGQTTPAGKPAGPAQAPQRAGRPQPPPVPPEFQAAKIMAMASPDLVKILNDPASTLFQKAKACMRLAMVGTKEAVPPMAALLADPELSHYARFGMVPIADPSVDEALRGALGKLKGKLLVGVIDSIGQRGDPMAIAPLTKLIYGADADVALAAVATLGRIADPRASAALEAALNKTKGPLREAVAASCLLSAEGMLGKGDRKGAIALYHTLSRPDMPKSVRIAAMHSTIAAETSPARPR